MTVAEEHEQERETNRARIVAEIRKLLETMNRKPHWHGGPGPCPVCGGVPRVGGV